MNFDSIWGLGLGTALFLAVILGLFYMKKLIRNRLFPKDEGRALSEAMAELLAFQATLQERAERGASDEEEDRESEGG